MPKEPEDKSPPEEGVDPVTASFFTSEPEPDMKDVPTEEELEKQARRDLLRGKSFGSLGSVDFEKEGAALRDDEDDEEEQEDEEGKKAGEAEEPEGDPEDKAPEEEAPKPKKKVSFRKPDEFTPPPPEDPKPKPEAKAEPEPEPEADDPLSDITDEDKAYIESLPEEAAETVAFLVDAAWVDPQYKGMAKKQLEYLRNHQAKVDELEAEDPDGDITENPRYIAWVKRNKPHIPAREVKRLEREIILKEAELRAEQKLEQKYKPQIEEQKKWRERQEKLPQAQKQSVSYSKSLIDTLTGLEEAKEPMEIYQKAMEEEGDPGKAFEAMQKEYPDEAEILLNAYRPASALGQELIAVRTGLKDVQAKWDEKGNPIGNRLHHELLDRIEAQEEAMKKESMAQYRVRDGRTFLPTREFRQLPADKRDKYWTFSTQDILTFLQAEARSRASKNLKSHQERVARYVERYGGKKPVAKKPDKPAPEKTPEKAPPASSDGPRKKGVDSPTPEQSRPSGEEAKSSAASLVDWD
jgi:hypothetical protein